MRKILFVTIPVLIAVVFGLFIWMQIGKQSMPNSTVNTQNESPTVMPTPVIKGQGTSLAIGTGSVEGVAGQDVLLDIALNKLEGTMLAADVIVTFDPQSLEYVGVTELNPEFDNPRKSVMSDGRLLLSFIKKPVQDEALSTFPSSVVLGKVQFRAKKIGTTQVRAEFDGSNKSSMVYLDGEADNQLTVATGSDIVIK